MTGKKSIVSCVSADNDGIKQDLKADASAGHPLLPLRLTSVLAKPTQVHLDEECELELDFER